MELTNSILNSSFSGKEWVKQMEDLMIDLSVHQLVGLTSIFQLAESVRISDPESYTPQLVGMGPLHHFRPHIWEMTAVKRQFSGQGLRRLNFPGGGDQDEDDLLRSFTDQVVTPLIPSIRAHYEAHIDIPDRNLASVLAVDFLFLLELILQGRPAGGDITNDIGSSSSSCSRDKYYCSADLYSALMKNVMMLENQIPLFLVADHHIGGAIIKSPSFQKQLACVCEQISPLGLIKDTMNGQQERPKPKPKTKPRHLLEYLYLQIVGAEYSGLDPSGSNYYSELNSDPSALHILEMVPPCLLRKPGDEDPAVDAAEFDPTYVMAKSMTQIIAGRIPWVRPFFSWLEGQWIFKHINRFLGSDEADFIPTASQINQRLGVKLSPTGGGGLRSTMISFDEEERTLGLPVFEIKPNCDALLRNLIAFESMSRGEDARVLTEYARLMGGLVRTWKDAELLRDAGIIIVPEETSAGGNIDTSSAVVVELFRSIGKAATGHVGCRAPLESQIQAVNRCYDRHLRTVISKSLRQCLKFGLGLVFFLFAYALIAYAVIWPILHNTSGNCFVLWCCWRTHGLHPLVSSYFQLLR